MAVGDTKLWNPLIDKSMNKQDLKEMPGGSATSITKLVGKENIATDAFLQGIGLRYNGHNEDNR